LLHPDMERPDSVGSRDEPPTRPNRMAFMDEFMVPSLFLIIAGSLIALIGTQLMGKARRTAREVSVPDFHANPLGRGKAVMAGGWFLFLLGFLGLLVVRLA